MVWSILSASRASSKGPSSTTEASRPSSVRAQTVRALSFKATESRTSIFRTGFPASICRSKAALILRYRRVPSLRPAGFLQRMVRPSHTSARKPMMPPLPFTKAKPSPLARTSPSAAGFSKRPSGRREATVPTYSPMDLGASMQAQSPLSPSKNSSV